VALSAVSLWMPLPAAYGSPGFHFLGMNATSTTQAGYLESSPATATVVDKFTVPTVTCSSTTFQAVELSAIVFASSTAQPPNGAGVVIACQNGSPFYKGQFLVNGSGTFINAFTPHPGDAIKAVASVSPSSTKLAVKDKTQGKSSSMAAPGATNLKAFWGVESLFSGTTLPVPNFGTANFTKGSVNAATVQASGGVAYDLKLTTVVDVQTGVLNATGNAWSEVFKAST
jgi:hypothetical protein